MVLERAATACGLVLVLDVEPIFPPARLELEGALLDIAPEPVPEDMALDELEVAELSVPIEPLDIAFPDAELSVAPLPLSVLSVTEPVLEEAALSVEIELSADIALSVEIELSLETALSPEAALSVDVALSVDIELESDMLDGRDCSVLCVVGVPLSLSLLPRCERA